MNKSSSRPSSAPLHRLKSKLSPDKRRKKLSPQHQRRYSPEDKYLSTKVKNISTMKKKKKKMRRRKILNSSSSPSFSPPALRPPTPKQIQEANNKMKTIIQVQKQNKATYDNVLRNVIKIQSTMRRFLAQKELKSLI